MLTQTSMYIIRRGTVCTTDLIGPLSYNINSNFGLGTIVFGIMSWLLLDEIQTLKTMISLLLAAAIILIQISNVVE